MFFAGQKYGSAAANVLLSLRDTGVATGAEFIHMQRTAILNKVNYEYGKELVRSRAANSPESAAAAVFARIAVAAEASPGPIKAWMWEAAATAALQRAGAAAFECREVLQALMEQERAAGWGSK